MGLRTDVPSEAVANGPSEALANGTRGARRADARPCVKAGVRSDGKTLALLSRRAGVCGKGLSGRVGACCG